MRVLATRAAALALVGMMITAAACTNPAAPDAPDLAPVPNDPAVTQPVATVPAASHRSTTDTSRMQVKQLLIDSAERHGVNPNLVMAVAWWESGWDQSQVSATGAVGIMQVEPTTAAAAGPRLLHRTADIHNAADNIELGVVVLKEDLDNFHNDLTNALVAYYEGPAAVTDWNSLDDGAKRYAWGVYRLAVAFSEGTGPA